MQEMLLNLLQEVLYAIIIVVVPIISNCIISYFKSKKEIIIKGREDEEFNASIIQVIDIIEKVVDTVSQTYVDSLKKEGKFNEEAQKEAFNIALTSVRGLINDNTQEMISTVYSDFDSWLKIQIESYIKSKKLI